MGDPGFRFPRAPRGEMRWVWFWRWVGVSLLIVLPVGLPFAIGFTLAATNAGAGLGGALPIFLLPFALLIGVSAGWGFLWASLALKGYSFEVRDDEVVVQRGVLFRTRALVPLRRVQDILVQSGPLLRAWKLSTVKLQTAGGGYGLSSPEGLLPGLRDGEKVAAELMERVKRLRGDV